MQASRVSDVGTHIITIEVEGKDLKQLDNESGGHRIQRVPPTERKGRVHTSTVTVAVLDPAVEGNKNFTKRSDADFKIEWYSGTGCGGQFRNKHQNSCRITHTPTGIVQTAQTRSRQNSQKEAMQKLLLELNRLTKHSQNATIAVSRKSAVGSGMRGDKFRTYRFQDNLVKDHNTGKQAACDKVMSGNFNLLW